MPAKRLSMRKIKEVLRLKWAKELSNRQIAQICGIGRPTVSEYLRRTEAAGLTWPLPAGLDEAAWCAGCFHLRQHCRHGPVGCRTGWWSTGS